MSTYVPDAVQKGLDDARIKRLKQASKLRIETADGYFRVLKLWDTGFSVADSDAPHLRGLVDVYEGPTHVLQCLIIASEVDGGQTHYEFKRMTSVSTVAPRDYATPEAVAVGLLEGPEIV